MRAELSGRQRLYLIWTFRNFRQLSVPLLNERQRALVIELFRKNAGIMPPSDAKLPVIGVVENFVPPPIEPAVAFDQASDPAFDSTTVSVSQATDLAPARKPAQIVVETPPEKPVERIARPEKIIAPQFEMAPLSAPALSSSTSSSSSSSSTPIFAWPRLAASALTSSKLATAVGALLLCIVSVAAWQRVQELPSSQAHNRDVVPPTQLQPAQLAQTNTNPLPDSPPSPEPAPIPVVAPPAMTHSQPAPEPPAIRTSINASISSPTSAPVSTRIAVARPAPTAPKRARTISHAEAAPKFSASGESSAIQATRPPLHFAYPDDVHTRGVIALTAALDPDGAVRSVRIVSGNRKLAEAAARAVRRWRYRPYLKDGHPVATETNIVISFFSDEAISMTFPPTIPARH